MKITPKLPDGFLELPYAGSEDPLSKGDLSQRLTNLYGNLEHGTVAILHGRWGSGKSTFASKWLATLKSQGFGTVHFDAFENDYITDPFIALNAVLIRHLDALPDKGGERASALKKSAVAVSKKLLIAGAKVGVKAASLGALSLADFDLSDEMSGAASDMAGDLAEAAVQRILEDHARADATFAAFRHSLSQVPSSLCAQEGAGVGKAVFVIDELDRCRPDFALGLIECLKHFFHTDSLHFVLIANKEFLVKSVESRYGLSESSDEYLDKFFDFSIIFEEAAQYRNSSPSVIYAKRVVEELIPLRTNDAHDLSKYISEIAGAFDLTFRQIEKISTNAALAYNAFGDGEYRPTVLVAYLCFLKAIHPKLYQSIKSRKFAFESFKKIIDEGEWEEHSTIDRVLSIFKYHSKAEIEENDIVISGYENSFSRFNFRSREDVLPYLANTVVDRFSR